jgi:hypothetical protein
LKLGGFLDEFVELGGRVLNEFPGCLYEPFTFLCDQDFAEDFVKELNVGAQFGGETERLGVEAEKSIHPFIIAEFLLPRSR